MAFMNPLNSVFRDPNKPTVQSQLVQGSNGMLQVQYIDPTTGQVIGDPLGQGYQIMGSQIADIESLGLSPTVNAEGATKPTTATETPTPQTAVGDPPPDYVPPAPEGGPEHGGTLGDTRGGGRDQSNNFGYFDKPGFMGMLGALPGALGMAGKGVNAVANANNVGAVNAARDAMDVPGMGLKESIGGIAKDRQGFVGNVDITNQAGQANQYSVGLEAMTPSGKTTLTPDEARARARANPENIALSEEQDEKGQGLGTKIRSYIEDIFGMDEDVETVERGGFTVAKEKTGGIYSGFPEAPTAPHAKERERDQSITGRNGRGGLSDAAQGAVDRGKGGLY